MKQTIVIQGTPLEAGQQLWERSASTCMRTSSRITSSRRGKRTTMSSKFQFSGKVSLLHLNARKEVPVNVKMNTLTDACAKGVKTWPN